MNWFARASVTGVLMLAAPGAVHGGYSVVSVTRTWEVGSAGLGVVTTQTLSTLDPVSNLTYSSTPFNPTSLTTGLARASQTSTVGTNQWSFSGFTTATWNSPITQPPPTIVAMTEMRVVFSVDDLTDVRAIGLGNGGIGQQNAAFGARLSRGDGTTVFTTIPGEPPPYVYATLSPGTYEWRVHVQSQTATGGAGFATMSADLYIPNPSGAIALGAAGVLCLLRRTRGKADERAS